MRVDSTKSNNEIPKEKPNKVSPNAEQSSNLSINNLVSNDTSQQKKDFASILKSTSEQNESIFESKKQEKLSEKKSVEDESRENKANSKKDKEVGEEKREKSDSDRNNDSEKDKGFGNIQTIQQQNLDEINIPNGRSILHVADLERIISKIRSQNVANGKQVVIELKRSVFEGLKLKITIGADKTVTAEFLAANESVKSQLNARSDELASLLKNRGVKLGKLQTSLDSQNDENNQRNQQEKEGIESVNNSSKFETNSDDEVITSSYSNTSYQA